MVSIVDVARAAGVSNKTVSRVVNDEPSVKPATKDKVMKAIEALGYVPNMAARLVRSSQSRTLGIITDYISISPYSGDIVRGIQDWAETNGRTVLLANTGGDPRREADIWRTFQSHQIEGVLYVSMYHRVIVPTPGGVSIRTVLINGRSDGTSGYASIEPDDYQGSRDLTRHVLELGHRRIGYLRLNPKLLGAEQRLSAFRDTVGAAGIAEADLDIRMTMEGPIGSENVHVFAEANDMLSQTNRPTILMCGNDEIALQAYLAALGLGLRIPEDVGIVGYDDFRIVSTALKPELTTAALPYYDLGYHGAELLGRQLTTPSQEPEHQVLPCPLVVRGSCARPQS